MPGSRWRSQQMWEPLSDYEAMEHLPKLVQSGLSFAEYARVNGLQRNALSDAIKSVDPEAHARIIEAHGGDGSVSRKRGASLESSVKGLLARRGYLVVKQYASKSAFDLLAVGLDKPVLMIQAKRDGKLPFSEWNALYELAVEHGCWPVLAVKAEPRGAHFYRLTQAKEQKGQRQDPFLAEFDPRDPSQVLLGQAVA